MEHTKGKWEVDEGAYLEKGEIGISNRMRRICVVNNGDGKAKANARLIAASPDLLEACKCLLAVLEGVVQLFAAPECWYLSIEEAKQAIAKAEGE